MPQPAPIYFVSLISRDNKPLYIQSFHESDKVVKVTQNAQTGLYDSDSMLNETTNAMLKYNFLSHMALDSFESGRCLSDPTAGDYALLFIMDGVSVYGMVKNSGVKIVVGTAMRETAADELSLVFKRILGAYRKLTCNPFQTVDEKGIVNNRKFDKEISDIVSEWNNR